MIRRQDLSVLSIYYLKYSAIRNLFLRLQNKPVTRILAFHEISNESLNYFEANLRFLAKNTNVVSFEDFFSGNLSSKRINVIITFDDGYKNWMTNAIPVLKQFKLPATFFVTSGFVDLSKADAADFNKTKLHRPVGQEYIIEGLLGKDLLRMIEKGFTIGGHTVNHSNLGMIQDRIRLRNEIVEDKDRLEKMAGVRIQYFAYPGGVYFSPFVNIPEVLKDAGYQGAVTTIRGFNTDRTDPYLLRRELTRASMPKQVFRARVYGNYDLVSSIKNFLSGLPKGNANKARRTPTRSAGQNF